MSWDHQRQNESANVGVEVHDTFSSGVVRDGQRIAEIVVQRGVGIGKVVGLGPVLLVKLVEGKVSVDEPSI